MRKWTALTSDLKKRLRHEARIERQKRLRTRRMFLESLEDRRMMATTLTLTMSDGTAMEGTANRGHVVLTRVTDDSSQALNVSINLSNSTTSIGEFDFESELGNSFNDTYSFTIPANKTTLDIYIRAYGDGENESTEQLVIALYEDWNSPPAYDLGAQSSVSVSVLNNAVPVGVADQYSVSEGDILEVAAPGVLANDSDDGPSLSVSLYYPAMYGNVTLNSDGSFEYDPPENYYGNDEFTYLITDGISETYATVVVAVNGKPVGSDDSYSTTEDTPLVVAVSKGVLGNDYDPEYQTLSATLVSGPAHGTLTLNGNGTFKYSPTANYSGSDSFTYRAADGLASSAPTTVELTVTSVNDLPIAAPRSVSGDEDENIEITLAGTDVESTTLSYEIINQPAHGTLTGTAPNLTYSPDADYFGTDSFTYRVNDGSANSVPASVRINLAETFEPTTASLSDAIAREGNILKFYATLNAMTSQAVTVNYSVMNGSAAAGIDFVGVSGTLTFVPGQTTQEIIVATIQDSLAESAETFELQLTAPVNATVADALGTGSITDSDPIPGISVVDRATVESASQMSFLVRLSAISGQDVTVNYETVDGTALAGTDYVAAAGTLTIPAGQQTGIINVLLSDDAELEANETFSIVLSGNVNATLTDGEGLGAILDDEPRAKVIIESSQSAIEGQQNGYFRLRRTGATTEELSVTFLIDAENSLAENGVDFDLLPGTATGTLTGAITFAAGQSTVDIPVVVVEDSDWEPTESLRVLLTDQSHAFDLGSQIGTTIQIHENTAAELPFVTIGERVNEEQTVMVPAASGGYWTLTLGQQTTAGISHAAGASDVQSALQALSNIGMGNVLVSGVGSRFDPFKVRFVEALGGVDVELLSVDITNLVSLLEPEAVVTVAENGVNGVNEAFQIRIEGLDETSPLDVNAGRFFFSWGDWDPSPGSIETDPRLSAPIGWKSSVNTIKAAIEAIPRVAQAGGTVFVSEVENTANLRILQVEFRGGLSNRDVSEALVFNDFSSQPIEDENGSEAVVLGSTVTSGSQGPVSEEVVIEVKHAQGGQLKVGSSANPLHGWFDLNADGAAVQTAMEATYGSGNIQVTGPAGGPWQVHFQGALAGRNIEEVPVDLSLVQFGGALVTSSRQGGPAVDGILDAAEGKPNGRFRVFRTGPTNYDLSVAYAVVLNPESETAAAQSDFRPLTGSVTIPAGQASADIVIRAIDDNLVEEIEDVQIVLIDPLSNTSFTPQYRLGLSQQAKLDILDNDYSEARPTLSITATHDANEADVLAPGYFRLTRSLVDSSQLIVHYRIESSSTAAENDYQALTGSAFIFANEASTDIQVIPLDDWRHEGTETLKITITGTSQPIYAVDGSATSTVNILDNDGPIETLPTVSVVGSKDATEAGTDGYVRLRRTGSTTAPLTVRYAVNYLPGFSTVAVDFEYPPGTSSTSPIYGEVTFGASESTVDIPIVAMDDFEDEVNEAVNIHIVNGTSSPALYAPGALNSGFVLIKDDDDPLAGPGVTAVFLTDDTGLSSSDRKTLDPRLTVTVGGTSLGGKSVVQFHHPSEEDVEFTPDASIVLTSGTGQVVYDPRVTDPSFDGEYGFKTISFRVVAYDASNNAVSATAWKPFVFELIQDANEGEVRVVGLRLERDTGAQDDDLVTALPAVTGRVEGDFGGGSARIEFDHFGDFATDATIDGSVALATPGLPFRYDPAAGDAAVAGHAGAFKLRYRLVEIDSEENETIGEWIDFDYSLEALPASQFYLHGLGVENAEDELLHGIPILRGSVAGVAHDPIIVGEGLSGAAGPDTAFAEIEIDLNGDEIVDRRAQADASGSFSALLVGLSGTTLVKVRAVEWSTKYARKLFSPWSSINVSVSEPTLPWVSQLRVKPGESRLTLEGEVYNFEAQDSSNLLVQLNFDEDPDADAEVVVGTDGKFTYSPPIIPSSLPGTVNYVSARTLSYAPSGVPGQYIELLSDWTTDYSGTLPSERYPFSLYMFRLLTDDGEHAYDSVTSVATLTGSTFGHTTGDDHAVEFDHDGDDIADGMAVIQEDGKFLYEPAGLDLGSQHIRVRTVVRDVIYDRLVYSDWGISSVYFTLAATRRASVEDFLPRHVIGTPDPIPVTHYTSFEGQLGGVSEVAYLTVQFDHGADGSVDGTATADGTGAFQYQPVGLAGGTQKIAARSVQYDPRLEELAYGEWTELEFTYNGIVNTAPVVDEFILLSDTGALADNKTANAAVVGSVLNEGELGNLLVEFDHDGDDVIDGVTVTDADGAFQYFPQGLALGNLTLRARAAEWDSSTSSYLRGDYLSLGFLYETQTDVAPVLVSLELGPPLSESDPTRHSLEGRVTNERSLKGLAVEFDFNNDGVVDQTATTDEAGMFSLQPSGLGFGSVGIKVRTREIDAISQQALVSAWSTRSLEYAQIVPDRAQVTTLDLLNDTGYPGDNQSSDARVTGTLSGLGTSQLVVVQFDHNGDEVPEGQVVVGGNLQFTYTPAGMTDGAKVLRARTKDFDHNGVAVFGAWKSLSFALSDTDQPLRITGLELVNDTGASDSDNSSAEVSLRGSITGLATYEYVTIEFDRDGDGTADGTSYNGGGEHFTIDQYTLLSGETDSHGLRTISVRAVDSGETPRASPWSTFSFVYSADPDGAAAQDLVSVVEALNASSLASEAAYDVAMGNAQAAHGQANEAANQNYDAAVGEALQNRNQAVEGARSDYDNAVNAANAAYLSALQAAAAAFAIDLGNFGGDTASFDFESFVWPDAPKWNRLQLPSDGSQPAPPVAGPTYTGMPFDYAAVETYKTAKSQFERKFAQDKTDADQKLKEDTRLAVDVYKQAESAATKKYKQAITDADKKYKEGLVDETDKPTDLNQSNRDHRDRIQESWDGYRSQARDLAIEFNGISGEARATLDGTINAAEQSYRDASQAAFAEWRSVVDHESVPPETYREATIAYHQKTFEAGQKRAVTIADARGEYDSTIHEALMTFRTSLVPKWEEYQTAVNDSTQELAEDIAVFNLWEATRSITAKRDLEQAKIDAEKVRAQDLADAAWTRDKSLAAARKENANSLAEADVEKWQAEITARRGAFSGYAATGTPWSAYQLALVNIEATYLASHSAAYSTHAGDVAQAAFVEAESSADAAKVRARSTADSTWRRDNDRLEARAAYWGAPASERNLRSIAEADALNTYRNTITAATATYNLATIEINGAREGSLMAASHAYDLQGINSHQFKVDEGSYYYGGTWYSGLSQAALAQRAKDRTQLEYDTQSSLREASSAFTEKQATASHALRETLRDLRVDELDEISAAQKAFQHSAATAAKTFAIEYVAAQGVERNSLAAASTDFVGSQAAATKVLDKGDATSVEVREIDEAVAQRDFEKAAAEEFFGVIDAWNANNSPWGNFQEALAAAEVNRAIVAGAANVAYATWVSNAGRLRSENVADLEEVLANKVALASQTRTGSLVNAENIFATDLGDGKEVYAHALATIAADKAIANRDEASAREAAEDDFEFSQSQASRAARLVYEEGVQAAALTKYMADTDAYTTYAMSDYGEEAQRALNEAREMNEDAYKDSHGEVWEVLRQHQANEIASRIMFYANREQSRRLHAADEEQWWDGARGDAEKLYASVVRETAIVLATAVASADNVYASTTVNASTGYDNTLVVLDSTYDAAAKAAELSRTVALDGVNSDKREAEVASRGAYNTALYVKHAADLQIELSTNATPLAAFEHAVAVLDANLSSLLADIRDGHQEALSLVSAGYITAVTEAEAVLASATRGANASLAIVTNNAQGILSLATANADSTLYVSSITAEALHAEQQVIVRVDYDNLKRDALNELNENMATASSGYAAEAAAAQKEYYLKVTENVEFGGPGYSWGWGGYYGYGYSGYGYYGYNQWWWGYGGYHYGRWEMNPDTATNNSYGWGWGGWGYGGWGWGWGGYYTNWSYDANAFEELQDGLEDAAANRFESLNSATTGYVTKIGDAQIERAADLGLANIYLATDRGAAAVTYRNAIHSAEVTYATAQRNAANSARGSINGAQQTYANSIATARIDQVTGEESLNIELKLAEGSAAITFAAGLAAGEAAFFYAAALDEAERAEAAALIEDTPEARFAALEASVKADWIDDLRTAYVTRETAKVTADAVQAHSLAIGWGNRNLARATALAGQSKLAAGLEIERGNTVANLAGGHAEITLAAEHARNNDNLEHRNTLEVEVATAEKAKAVEIAEAEKTYQLARLEKVQEDIGKNHNGYGGYWYGGYWGGGLFNYNYWGYGYDHKAWQARRLDLAEADLTYVTSMEDAKLDFQKDESTSRKTFSQTTANAEKARALGVAAATLTAELAKADLQKAVDATFSLAEESYWTAETKAANTERTDAALADVGFWTAQEGAHVTAAKTIDDALVSPWSDFLVAKATEHGNWWASVTDEYMAMIADRNKVESDWQTDINTSHATQEKTIREAAHSATTNEAKSAKTRDDSLANLRANRILGLLEPASKYLESVATSLHDREIAVTKAQRDFAENDDANARDKAMTEAYDKDIDLSRQARRTYLTFEASAIASDLPRETEATSSHLSRMAYITRGLREAEANAVFEHQDNDSKYYLTAEKALAAIDKAYSNFEASSLASLADSLATNIPSPWSAQYAAVQAQYQVWTGLAATALETRRVKDATEQSKAESKVYEEERDLQVSAAIADYDRALSGASNAMQVAGAQAEALMAQGSSGQYNGTVPELSGLPALPSYAIATEGTASFYVGNPGYWGWGWPYNSYGYFGYGSIGYWPGSYNVFGYYGGWGYGGYNYYGFSYYGDYGYSAFGYYGDYFGWSLWGWNWASSSEPAEQQLPYKFWEISEQSTQVASTESSRLQRLKDVSLATELIATRSPAATGGTANSTWAPIGANQETAYSRIELIAALEEIDPAIAAFFSSNVLLTYSALPERPSSSDSSEQLQDVPSRNRTGTLGRENDRETTRSAGDSSNSVLPQQAASVATRSETNSQRKTTISVPKGVGTQQAAMHVVEQVSAPGTPPANHPAASQTNDIRSAIRQQNHDFNSTNKDARRAYIPLQQGQASSQQIYLGTFNLEKGWFHIANDFGGGRATTEAMFTHFYETRNGVTLIPDRIWSKTGSTYAERLNNTRANIQAIFDAIRSPTNIDTNSGDVLLAIDGTGNHIESQDNVARLYNAFQGTKFYYGGVGNPIDDPSQFSQGVAIGWNKILDRINGDLRRLNLTNKAIYVVGFSRGAAIAVELTRMNPQIRFHFVGLFDPVYSHTLAGHQSLLLDKQTTDQLNNNYVTATLPSNVQSATAIYADDEFRSWFPATLFSKASNGTRFSKWLSPGQHGEIGGHWQNNPIVGKVNLSLMANEMMNYGATLDLTAHQDEHIKRSLNSAYLDKLIRDGDSKAPLTKGHWLSFHWRSIRREAGWSIPTVAETATTISQANSQNAWQPWGLGIQGKDKLDKAAVLKLSETANRTLRKGPIFSHYPRQINLYMTGRINTYFTPKNKTFFDTLFSLEAMDNGELGWSK